ncbi:UDP-N-acetylmuramoyl-L-alanyl-D-glutamate--2, 6-diaminopimelate ligase [Candidatus Sulfotelmatomonas gaucii]|uniref:UDP-N-acetylmuramoyl-L-alanyl-D-glutamate--2,6-diaminopimelate ligase n=1 Tax=Candidatus Sulfuritelmatomonas gaucii TaxID=2043161 RepID=A0A2N9LK10_9BACT|nr:UDP-N-acetylmuramoyl-L-alanyl-D-glutamate--2, 6-diaminopimelate ligase [Candidatus Sulfotelmatomonas gaucii]
MIWNSLIAEITAVGSSGASAAPITGIEYDSRHVRPGAVFVAMKGGSTDGNRFVDKAVASGALGIITDSAQTFDHLLTYHPGLPVLEVEHGRHALSQASAAFFGHPERRLSATGITGTNGKTTTAYLVEALLNADARPTILIGTIEYHVAGETRPSIHTTPESRDLFELMAEGVARGASELVTEVSSHALGQGRMIGIPFDVAVFTNLTRDHLDYHQTMDKYFAAKRLLFDGTVYPAPRVAVINAHDARAEALADASRNAGAEIRTYGIETGDWCATEYTLTPSGAAFTLETPVGTAQLASRLAGEVNILNLLAALTAAHARGVSFADLVAGVPGLAPVSGRFQPVDAGQPFTVIVDYAHTDDALRNLTALARKMTKPAGTRVITLFGCGGDRDRTKRPKMGEAAGEGSDFVVATSDNPRSEDPASILAEIEPGLQATGVQYTIEVDRAAAIRLALEAGKPGDVVLLAGKGHETEQILADRTVPFNDAEVALAVLEELGYSESLKNQHPTQ